MPLRVSGKIADIGEALRRAGHASRVSAAVKKYFDGTFSGSCDRRRDGTGFRTDCTLASGLGRDLLQAEGAAHDAYQSSGIGRPSDRKPPATLQAETEGPPAAANGVTREVDVPSYVIQAPDEEEEPRPANSTPW